MDQTALTVRVGTTQIHQLLHSATKLESDPAISTAVVQASAFIVRIVCTMTGFVINPTVNVLNTTTLGIKVSGLGSRNHGLDQTIIGSPTQV